MARLCSRCGAQIGDATKFCITCGAAIEQQYNQQPQAWQRPPQYGQPQAWQQPPQYGQQQPPRQPPQQPPRYGQPYQQYQQQGQPYPPQTGAAPQKKRRVPLALIIVIGVVVLLGLTVGVIMLVTGNTASLDKIKIGKDEVPSVKFVLGEERNVSGVSTSIENGVTKKEIKYSVSENQNEEMYTYAVALTSDYGYFRLNDNDFTGTSGHNFQFAKESVEDGYLVIVRIDYDRYGYTITLSRGTGTLNFD